jgi:hypothetical protein
MEPNFSLHFYLDFESYYKKGSIDIRTMGAYNYLRHPAQDIYLVSAVAMGIEWVGHPKDFDWNLTNGKLLIAHNAAFDKLVYERLQQLGIIPAGVHPKGWQCSANLAAFLQVPRDLASASKFLLGKTVDKSVRSNMNGKYVKDLSTEEYQALLDYGLQDSVNGWELWTKYSPQWPEAEQRFSQHTIKMCHRGIQVDLPMLDASITNLEGQALAQLEQLPWVREGTAKPLSKPALDAACRAEEVEPPKSWAMGNEEANAWFEKYADQFPFAMAVRQFRRMNSLKKKLAGIKLRTRSDGRFLYEQKYCGASTGRDSGAGGINMQNLHKDEIFDIDVRGHFIPCSL